ncbi:NAD-dependent epimerase/dehydratase family protein [Candidatus Micrarchaeota archaeon]|nr:NAD-dependent epimerase/dehydratase family protein [Candidatus Micrarchaeota archaeon]
MEGMEMKYDVLLAGATGFLGSHILEALLDKKLEVAILKRSTSDTRRISGLLGSVDSFDVDQLSDAVASNSFRNIINSVTAYPNKTNAVSKLVDANLVFPLKLLELCKDSRFINLDTVLQRNLDFYTLSKAHFVDYAKLISKSFVNLKVEHMYGPKDNPSKLIPYLMIQMLEGKERIPLTKGEQKRDFIYVSDVVDAISLILDSSFSESFSEFDIGTAAPISVKEAAEKIKEVCNSQSELCFGEVEYRLHEPMLSTSESTSLRMMGWKPNISFDEGLKKTMGWYTGDHNE